MSLSPTSAGFVRAAASTLPSQTEIPYLESLESERYRVVYCIKSIDDFDNIRSAWEQVYCQDEQASLFLSWTWLRGWMNQNSAGIWILGVQYYDRPDSPGEYVAFLPLRLTSERVESWC
jgi:CelD/BcsL family acetyltransferase involved in cellulose biosynthesis